MQVTITADAFCAICLLFPFRGTYHAHDDTWTVEIPDEMYTRIASRLLPGETLSIGLIRATVGAILKKLQADGMSFDEITKWLAARGVTAEFIRPS